MGKIHMDQVRRRLFAEAEIPRLVLKSIIMSSRLPPSVRQAAQARLSAMPANTSATRIRMRCVLTGRPRAVDSKTRLSRIMFRKLASEGQLPGIWKAR
ncbi:Ribosomal protein S14, mitochondrial [Gracilariopsis chorda]|uniref:Ribosomal protein S14, mitochondrial n=1 Tax=Gracilariopsis chorda TaxID=448386 RepID=A0A2V3IPG4_9FLOR|nr:Ribosomal protein S14, mitochondrial [Gracilariopsis chorda]|eukprot:PXF43020.1 Ribosomal protein S14, mitochondrial [Gracilariopsis chorda]